MTVNRQLDRLEASGLLRVAQFEPELEYLFRHALVQEAAYGSLLEQDRQRLHLLTGQTLERLYPEHLASRELAAVLGHHFYFAKDDERALKYFIQAGDAALGVYANLEAVAHYDRAIDLATHLAPSHDVVNALYLNRGRALELVGQHQHAWRNYQDMEHLAREHGDRTLELAALTAQAVLCSTPTPLHNLALADTLLARVDELASDLNDRAAQARILWIHMLRLIHGPYDPESGRRAIDYGKQALAIARELNLREQMAFALNDLAIAYIWADDIAHAASVCEQAISLWRELGNMPMLTDSLLNAAFCVAFGEDYVQVLALAGEAYSISAAIGNAWSQASSLSHQAEACLELGQVGQALAAFNECLELSERGGFVYSLINTRARLGQVHSELGDAARGLELVRQACQAKQESGGQLALMACHLSVLTQVGDLEAAEGLWAEMYRSFSLEALRTMVRVPPIEAEFMLAKGDFEGALALMDEFLAYLARTHIRRHRAQAMHLKSCALRGLGRLDEARAALARAQAEAEARNLRWRLWRILVDLSELEAQCGNLPQAGVLRQQARDTIEYIAAHIDPPELRASFLNKPELGALLE